jgi:hypothetical protein
MKSMEAFLKELDKYGESAIDYSHEEIKEEANPVQTKSEDGIIITPTNQGVTMTKYNKQTLLNLLNNPAYVDEAIRLLGGNQTAGELRAKSTHLHNDIGFSAAYGRTGTRMYEFVTGINTRTGEKKWAPKSLAHPVANKVFGRYIGNHGLNNALELGRKVASIHWKQLEALTTYQPQQLSTGAGEQKPQKKQPAKVTFQGVEVVSRSGKGIKVRFDSRYIWLPASQVDFDTTTDTLVVPAWLAKNKQMAS